MAFLHQFLIFSLSLLCTTILQVSSQSRHYTPPSVPRLTDMFNHVSVDQAFTITFGSQNIEVLNNGSMCTLALDKSSGSGLATKNMYHYGFFSTAIKLPAGISSGVVVAFYLTNWDKFPHNHDEIDIEILGHDKRNDWVVQTNIYANGSVRTGREEKFYLWFDPTEEHHYYSILWNSHHIVFFIDNIPVREFPSTGAFSAAYPSKPMWLHVTMWDGSEWATSGGKYPVNYTNAPFVASFADLEVNGCVSNPDPAAAAYPPCSAAGSSSGADPVQGQDFAKLSSQQIAGLDWARRKLMFYSYCKDTRRYKNLLPECK